MVDAVKLKDRVNRLAALDMRFRAAMQEYVAACLTHDAKEQTRLRDNLHTFLDAQLDLTAEVVHMDKTL